MTTPLNVFYIQRINTTGLDVVKADLEFCSQCIQFLFSPPQQVQSFCHSLFF